MKFRTTNSYQFSLLFVILLFPQFSSSQTTDNFCQTKFKENKFFSTEVREDVMLTRTEAVIPIALHLFTDDMGNGNEVTPEIFQNGLDSINLFLAAVNLRAELCVLNIIMDDDNVNPTYDLNGMLMDSIFATGHVNVYITNTVAGQSASGSSTIVGGQFADEDHLFILGKGFTYGLFAHELGHFFGLYHTFENQFGEELVDGTNCETAGDLICDTNADFGIQRTDVDSVTCSWDAPGSVLDANSQPYEPSTSNFMSYTKLHCAKDFTPLQLNVISNTYHDNINYLTSNCEIISSVNSSPPSHLQLSIFPNPTREILNIKGELKKEMKIKIYNLLGELVFYYEVGKNTDELKIPVNNLSPNVYLLNISLQEINETSKVVIF